MAGNLQLYALIFVGIEGTLLVEEQQVDLTRTSNSQPIDTVAKGYSGESPGAARVELDVTNAIPQGGFEFDMGAKIAGLIPVNFQVRGPGGKTNFGTGFVYQDSIQHGVNQEAKYMFRLRAPLSLFA